MKHTKQIIAELTSVVGAFLVIALIVTYLTISFVLAMTFGRMTFLPEELLSLFIFISQWLGLLYLTCRHILPAFIFVVKANTGVILFNPLSLASKDDKLAGQREVGSGYRLKLPWEQLLKEVDLKWRTINIPDGFKARSKVPEKVEVGIKGYQKWRPALGYLRQYNTHDDAGITSVIQGRIESFLSTAIAKEMSDDLPGKKDTIATEFNGLYGPGQTTAREEDYGIEVEDFNITDLSVSKAVELANELGKVMGSIRKEAKAMVQDGIVNGEPTISMRDASIITAGAAGAVDPKFSVIELGALNSGEKKGGKK